MSESNKQTWRPPPLPEQRLQSHERLLRCGIILGLCAMAFLSLWAPFPYGKGMDLIHQIFGIPCPTCGMTRAMKALLRGDLAESLYFHMGALPLALGCLMAIFNLSGEAISGKKSKLLAKGIQFLVIHWKWVLVGLLLFWLGHVGWALFIPKPQLLLPNAPLFPEFLYINDPANV